MTARDEARKKCIAAQMNAFIAMVHPDDRKRLKGIWLEKAFEAAFDSLNGIVTVNLPEATAQMIEAAVNEEYPSAVFRAMSTRGNLTNPPERTP